MLEMGTSGLMSGDGKRGVASASAPALVLDSTIVPHQDEDATELDQTEEVSLVKLPADDQSGKVVQPSKQAFDFPAAAIAAKLTPVLGFWPDAIALVGRDQPDAASPQAVIQRITVVGQVADHALRPFSSEPLLQRGLDQLGFMRRSACNPHGDRKTMAVRDCHDLGPFAAACWTNCTAPFLAPLKEASINVSARSSWPRARRSSAKRRKSLTSVPIRTHCWNRRWQVWYGGNLSRGSSDHCAPVRRIHNTPSSTCRVSRQGRPRRFWGVLGSTNGFNNSHCASVSSIPTDVLVNSNPHNYLVRFVFMRKTLFVVRDGTSSGARQSVQPGRAIRTGNLPVRVLLKLTGPESGTSLRSNPCSYRCPFYTAKPLREGLRVAVFAASANRCAAANWVLGCIRPFDLGFGRHRSSLFYRLLERSDDNGSSPETTKFVGQCVGGSDGA